MTMLDDFTTGFATPFGHIPHGQPEARGHAAIASIRYGLLALPGFAVIYRPQILTAAANDLAYDHGSYAISSMQPSNCVSIAGKYDVIWKRIGDLCKVALDIDNFNERPR